MKESEIIHIIIAIIVLSLVIGFESIIRFDTIELGLAVLFAFIIITLNVLSKKTMAYWLDSAIEHKIWFWSRFGFSPKQHLKKAIPAGVIVPLFVTAFSLGIIKVMTVLTYETRALKKRAAKRFGHYSFTEMTDWHNGLVGAIGIIITLLVSFIAYWIPVLEPLARFAAFYAFFNMLPFSKLDGSQIFFGSRILWYTLAIITLIFTTYAIWLV